MEEELFQRNRRTGVRGNIFSFHMPWEDIYACLSRGKSKDKELMVPHPPGVLCHLVKLHIKTNKQDQAVNIKDMMVRRHVVLQLGKWFAKQGHPAFKPTGMQTLDQVIDKYEEAVKKYYPSPQEQEDLPEEKREGVMPQELKEVLVECESNQRQPRSAIFDKNATPAEGARSPGGVFLGIRPQAVLLERTSEGYAEPNAQGAAALNQYSELQVQTGSTFVEQFNPKYISQAFPAVLPYHFGGPEFKEEDHKEARAERGAKVTPPVYTKGMSRRSEGQIRNSWDFLPGARNLTHRFKLLNTPGLTVRPAFDIQGAALNTEASASQLTEAASTVYDKIWSGKYGNAKNPLPIAGDITKLPFAHNLSATERILINNMKWKASHVEGTQEIRKIMGHRAFGARVVYGEAIFITISPSERHSGLALRLLRYRRNDFN